MTDPTIATPEEILTAVERWARAAGFHARGTRPPPPRQWSFEVLDGQAIVYPMRNGARGHGERVNPATALAWALCVDAGVTVDVGRCPECEVRGGGSGRKLARFEWQETRTWYYNSTPAIAEAQTDWLRGQGWQVAEVHERHFTRHVASRPCPTCNADPDYRHRVEAARLVLEATREPCPACKPSPDRMWCDEAIRLVLEAKRHPCPACESSPDCIWCDGTGYDPPGDPNAREAIEVLATRLQQEGDPFGDWLLAWIFEHTGWRQEALALLLAALSA